MQDIFYAMCFDYLSTKFQREEMARMILDFSLNFFLKQLVIPREQNHKGVARMIFWFLPQTDRGFTLTGEFKKLRNWNEIFDSLPRSPLSLSQHNAHTEHDLMIRVNSTIPIATKRAPSHQSLTHLALYVEGKNRNLFVYLFLIRSFSPTWKVFINLSFFAHLSYAPKSSNPANLCVEYGWVK